MKRRRAERRARIEAEGRIAVFSNVIHHLNNPLSHLQGAHKSGNSSFNGLVNTVFSLLPESSDDEDLKAVRSSLDRDVDGFRQEFKVAGNALMRAASAVSVLRTISGVDGTSFSEHTLGELIDG